MNSEKDRKAAKIGYEKPSAVDLGAAAPVIGGSCALGDQFEANGRCIVVGNHAYLNCSDGNNASFACTLGKDDQTDCASGISV